MTNNERRNALNRARAEALRHAVWAEEINSEHTDHPALNDHIRLSTMWSQVAQALKDGDPVHDGPDNIPASQFTHPTTLER